MLSYAQTADGFLASLHELALVPPRAPSRPAASRRPPIAATSVRSGRNLHAIQGVVVFVPELPERAATTTVRIPERNLFNVEGLGQLMEQTRRRVG